MKKIVLTVLVAALLLLTFVGCAPKTFTVTFDTDGGSTVAAQTVKEGEKAQKPTPPRQRQDLNLTTGTRQRRAARFLTLTKK